MDIFKKMGIDMDDVKGVIQDLGSIAGAVFSALGTAISTAWSIIKPILVPLLNILSDIVAVLGKITFNAIKEGASFLSGILGGKGKEGAKSALGDSNFAGGTTAISEQGRELFATPSGMLGLSPNTRSNMSLPQGTQIFSNKKTQKILNVAKNFTTNRNQNVTSQGSNVSVTIPVSVSSGISEAKIDQLKKLAPAIKEMILQVLSDKESEQAYAWGDM